MKKTIIIIGLILTTYILIGEASEDTVIIPNEAIRLRVLANSNSDYDQKIKNKVKDEVQLYLSDILKNSTNIQTSRTIISNNISEIKRNVSSSLTKVGYNMNYNVNFGLNYFPPKEYKGVTYNEGYYESLLITLGSGKGDNWWCVLFPPLCLIEAEEDSEVEYKSFTKEILEKYM